MWFSWLEMNGIQWTIMEVYEILTHPVRSTYILRCAGVKIVGVCQQKHRWWCLSWTYRWWRPSTNITLMVFINQHTVDAVRHEHIVDGVSQRTYCWWCLSTKISLMVSVDGVHQRHIVDGVLIMIMIAADSSWSSVPMCLINFVYHLFVIYYDCNNTHSNSVPMCPINFERLHLQ